MTRLATMRFRPCLPILLLLASASATAAPVEIPASAAPAIERARAALERTPLEGPAATEAAAALASAETLEAQSEAAIEAVRTLREATATASRDTRGVERALQGDPVEAFRKWREAIPERVGDEVLEAQLAGERAEVMRLRAEIADLRAALAPVGGSGDIEREAELQLQIDTLQRRIAAGPQIASDTPPALEQARMAAAQAELRAAHAELARRQIERETAPARRTYQELRLRRAQRDLGEREQRVAVLQGLIAERQGDAMRELLTRLEAQAAEFADADPLLRGAANDALAAGRELATTTSALAALRRDEPARSQARDDVANALRNTRARLSIEGQDEALGLILVLERRRLIPPDVLAARLQELRSALARARLQQVALAEARGRLADLAGAVSGAVDAAEYEHEAEAAEARGTLYRLYGDRAELLPRLDSVQQRHVAALEQAEALLLGQLTDTRALRAMLDQRVYWIRSNASVDGAWFGRVGEGWADLLKPSRFATSASLGWRHAAEHPAVPLIGLLVFALLLRARSRAQRWTDAIAPPLRRPAEDSYLRTWKSLGITLLAALPWALLAWLIGYVLRSAGEAGRFSDSLGRAFVALSSSLFLLEFLRFLVLERGLAHLHFRWMRARRQAIARALPWAYALLLPMQLLIVLAFTRNQDLAIDTAARMLLVAFCAVAAFALWRLLAPGALWVTRGGLPEPRRLRQLLRLAATALFVALALVILDGFVFSGAVVLACLWGTAWTVVAVGVFHGMVSRWFLLGERQLALKRAVLRREAAAQDGRDSGSDEGGAEITEEAIALETVNAQTGRVLRALTLALWVGGLLWVWSDLLPALARLDEIVLWNVAAKTADGAAISEAVSLRAVLFGALVLVLTTVAARNLPGLLEIGLLSRAGLDAPSRYAITALSRYAIVIVGSIVGLGLLGLRWSQLQWMAAALTVGLGFGLQEIFANFVSGLILLSERPFRVGDVITIGDQTGTVTRISTRATTLLDFDGKEVVVPNKTFITDRLVNWTLSDTQTRVIIRVGVAYGSDVAKVHRLLQKVADEHPLVLREPQPRSWFMAFGASSLDFELRVFVGAMSDRLPVMNELNGRVAELFAAEDIEIAFPQLDLHVRDLPRGPEPAPGPA